jgi:hypothetical protein
MTRFRVIPYRNGSRSATALSRALDGRLLRLQGSTFRPRPDDVIINWGNTNLPTIQEKGCFLNKPEEIRFASNKLSFFDHLTEQGCADILPKWSRTCDAIPDEDFPVVCRTVLAGHSGEGIVIANNRAELVPAPLYTKYIKKQSEFRIHLGKRYNPVTHTIAIQQKRRSRDVPDDAVNWQVRNHDNGFIYARDNVNCPALVFNAACRAFEASNLDFGAVDVIYNERENRAYVLEINTAPGLEGQTLTDYVNFFDLFRRN